MSAAPIPPQKPTKRITKPMPQEFKKASSYAEKRLPEAIKEKSKHVGAVASLDAEINDLVRVIKALGGTVDPQAAGQQPSYFNPSYRPPFQPIPEDPLLNVRYRPCIISSKQRSNTCNSFSYSSARTHFWRDNGKGRRADYTPR